MKTVIPVNEYILCECIENDSSIADVYGFSYTSENVTLYRIIKISYKLKDSTMFNVGDVILTNSTPTKIIIDDVPLFLIKDEYIIGKIDK